MFLSNIAKILIVAFFACVLFQACGGSQSNSNKDLSLAGRDASKFPFPTKEPEVYQGEFVIGDGKTEDKYFVARNGEKWRFDFTRDGEPWITQMNSGDVYFIDHTKKTYSTLPSSQMEKFDAGYFNSLTWGFFRGANYIDYDEVARENGVIKFKARTLKDSKTDIVVAIDEKSEMMVRQEITSTQDRDADGKPITYIYEVRNLKFETDANVFEIPSGYRKAASIENAPLKTTRPSEK